MRKKVKRCEQKVITSTQRVLKRLRQEQGLTLKQAGEKLSISLQAIDAIEQGRVYLTDERIEEIVKAYGLTMMDFKRMDRVLKREKRPKREVNITVMSNQDRRSYQKIVTKECKVLKSLRKEKGISQDKASELCGYSRPTIGHIENGRIELDQERINYIVRSYGFEIAKFEDAVKRDQQRDEIIEMCEQKIRELDSGKLELVKNLLATF